MKKRNYEILHNTKEIIVNNGIINEIKNINEIEDFNLKIYKRFKLYNNLTKSK